MVLRKANIPTDLITADYVKQLGQSIKEVEDSDIKTLFDFLKKL